MKPKFFIPFLLIFILVLSGCLKEIEDNSKPIIQILGNNPHYMRLNTHFNDTGIIVSDNYGIYKVWSDISALDTSRAGRYTVKYFATDFAENTSEAHRTVVVRIEGFNLKGLWDCRKTEPYPGGQVSTFTDSLFNPGAKKIYFSNLSTPPAQFLKADIIGSLGDTLAISKQLIFTSDTLVSYLLGVGILQADAKSFEITYHRINDRPGKKDTLIGKLNYTFKNK